MFVGKDSTVVSSARGSIKGSTECAPSIILFRGELRGASEVTVALGFLGELTVLAYQRKFEYTEARTYLEECQLDLPFLRHQNWLI